MNVKIKPQKMVSSNDNSEVSVEITKGNITRIKQHPAIERLQSEFHTNEMPQRQKCDDNRSVSAFKHIREFFKPYDKAYSEKLKPDFRACGEMTKPGCKPHASYPKCSSTPPIQSISPYELGQPNPLLEKTIVSQPVGSKDSNTVWKCGILKGTPKPSIQHHQSPIAQTKRKNGRRGSRSLSLRRQTTQPISPLCVPRVDSPDPLPGVKYTTHPNIELWQFGLLKGSPKPTVKFTHFVQNSNRTIESSRTRLQTRSRSFDRQNKIADLEDVTDAHTNGMKEIYESGGNLVLDPAKFVNVNILNNNQEQKSEYPNLIAVTKQKSYRQCEIANDKDIVNNYRRDGGPIGNMFEQEQIRHRRVARTVKTTGVAAPNK